MRKFVLACAALALLIAVPAVAQETRGSIEGVVKDTTGGVLPGVTVEATHRGRRAAQRPSPTQRASTGSRRCTPGTYVGQVRAVGLHAGEAWRTSTSSSARS